MDKSSVPLFIERMAKRAPTFADLTELALSDLRAIGKKAEMVCGPITTGGYGNVTVNLLVFNHAIEVLQNAGRPMFSQMPYEAGLADLEHAWKREHPEETYCHPILTEFYGPIFCSGLVKRGWFLPGWKTSKGAQWEHVQFEKFSIPISYLNEGWTERLILPPDLD